MDKLKTLEILFLFVELTKAFTARFLLYGIPFRLEKFTPMKFLSVVWKVFILQADFVKVVIGLSEYSVRIMQWFV